MKITTQIIKLLGFIALLALFSLVVSLVQKYVMKPEIVISTKNVQSQQSPYYVYNSIKDSKLDDGKQLKVCANNNCKSVKKYKVIGQIAKAYLLIDASINNKPLNIWDGIYFKISKDRGQLDNEPSAGGHLVLDDSNVLSTPINKNSSIYLYDMSSISYLPSITATKRKKDRNFLKYINLHTPIYINTYISSNKHGKKALKEVSIYYECLADGCDIQEVN